MNSLPHNPAYYDTKRVSDYISNENKDMFFSVLNNHYINHCILRIEELFKDEGFLGFQLGTVCAGEEDYFFECKVNHAYSTDKDKIRLQKRVMEIIQQSCSRSLEDMGLEDTQDTTEYLQESGLWNMSRDTRFENYHKLIHNNANFIIFPEYEKLLNFLKTGISSFTVEDNMHIHETTFPRICLNIQESKEFANDLLSIQNWISEYEKKLKIIELIKSFDNKECDKLLIDRLSGKPSLYVKNDKYYIVHTDVEINLSEKMKRQYNVVDKSMNYADFTFINQIREGLSKRKFDETITSVNIEKERKLLNQIVQHSTPPAISLKRI